MQVGDVFSAWLAWFVVAVCGRAGLVGVASALVGGLGMLSSAASSLLRVRTGWSAVRSAGP